MNSLLSPFGETVDAERWNTLIDSFKDLIQEVRDLKQRVLLLEKANT